MIVLSYLGPLALIPLMTTTDPEMRWHARNGLVLFLAALAAGILLAALSAVRGLGCLFLWLVLFLPLAWLALTLVCIVKARRGGRLPVPGIAPLADRLPELSRGGWRVATAAGLGAILLWLFLLDGLELLARALDP